MALLFFFKHNTAYEMRISDWSSDVCSSDLSVLVVDLTLRDALSVEAMRHHPVHRAPIIAEQQIEAAHIARQVAIARQRRTAVQRRRILRKINPYPWRDCVARAQRIGHGRQDDVVRAILHQVHQPHRPCLLAAEREAGMQVEDAQRMVAPGLRGFGHETGRSASQRSMAGRESGWSSAGAWPTPAHTASP